MNYVEGHQRALLLVKELVPAPHVELDYQQAFRGNLSLKKCSVNQTPCDYYQLILSNCTSEQIEHTLNGTQLQNISFHDVDIYLRGCQMSFKIIGYNYTRNICQEVLPYLTCNSNLRAKNNIHLEDLKVPSSQFCVDLPSNSDSYIVLVNKDNKGTQSYRKYCNCFLVSGDIVHLISKCFCYCKRSHTLMTSLELLESKSNVQACFSNFSHSLNNSFLHVFESKRFCDTVYSYQQSMPQRVYTRHQKILVGKFYIYLLYV